MKSFVSRTHTALTCQFFVVAIVAYMIAVSNVGIAHAQCDYYTHPCTIPPMTYANGVIEGPVAPPSTQPANSDLAYTRVRRSA